MEISNDVQNGIDDSQAAAKKVEPLRLSHYDDETQSLILLGVAFIALDHRIKNTFNIIRPNIGRLRQRLRKELDGEHNENLEILDIIEQNLRNTSELMDIVEWLRKPAGPATTQDVNSLLYAAWDELSTIHLSTQVRASFDLPEAMPPVRVNDRLLAEVIRIVLENSLEATSGQTGYVNIRSRHLPEEQFVEILIEDNGPGIPPSILSKLFERPIRSGATKGMGLWLARLILARLGGDISVKSTSPNTGTIMEIRLPTVHTSRS